MDFNSNRLSSRPNDVRTGDIRLHGDSIQPWYGLYTISFTFFFCLKILSVRLVSQFKCVICKVANGKQIEGSFRLPYFISYLIVVRAVLLRFKMVHNPILNTDLMCFHTGENGYFSSMIDPIWWKSDLILAILASMQAYYRKYEIYPG